MHPSMNWRGFRREKGHLSRAVCSIGLSVFILFSFVTICNSTAEPVAGESAFKATLIAKLLHYIEWPKKVLPRPGDPILFGFLGNDPIIAGFSDLASDGSYRVKGRPVAIKRSSNPGDLKNCQAVFISKSAQSKACGSL